jgi:hypothetical protein
VPIILSSTSELLSTRLLESLAIRLFFFPSFLRFFGFNSRCIFQHFSLVWPSMLQLLQWLLGSLLYCVGVVVFLYFLPFHFFFPSLEASWFYFFFKPLGCPFFWPIFYRYYACTQASSIVLGLKSITYFRR